MYVCSFSIAGNAASEEERERRRRTAFNFWRSDDIGEYPRLVFDDSLLQTNVFYVFVDIIFIDI